MFRNKLVMSALRWSIVSRDLLFSLSQLPLLLNADINQTVSYEEFYRKSLAERSSPQPSTSKGGVLENIPENNESATETVVEKDSSLIILDSPFVTQRTPAKVRAPKPVDDDV